MNRIEALRKCLDNNEGALILSDVNRRYFSGFDYTDGAVLITENSTVLFADSRYIEKARQVVKDFTVVETNGLYKQILTLLKAENVNKIFVETDFVSVAAFEKISSALDGVSVSRENVISKKTADMRAVKSECEIASIKKAQDITDKAFSHILSQIKPGVSEKEIALELEFFMRKLGSEGVSFDIIAVSGKNSSLPHGVPTDKKIENGDFLTLDFGAVCDGYHSDMTRTVAVGNVDKEQRLVYNTVLKAQSTALCMIKPGIMCKLVDKAARDVITTAGFGDCFGHGLGHSVGLEIHESPSFNTRDETLTQKGQVITVEPGIYLQNKFGVRIEDMVLVTDEGTENLTKSPKELIIL